MPCSIHPTAFFFPLLQAVVRDYALSEALLREGREKRQLLGLPEHLTTDQAGAYGWRACWPSGHEATRCRATCGGEPAPTSAAGNPRRPPSLACRPAHAAPAGSPAACIWAACIPPTRTMHAPSPLPACPAHVPTQIIASAAAVMDSTINHLEGRYGSARNYLKAIGLTDAELTAIVRNLTAADAPLPAAVERAARACGAD